MPHDFNQHFQDLDLDAEMREAGVAKPFFTLSARELLTQPCPPRVDLLGDAILFEAGLAALIAPPGTGKSRAIVQMAAASIIGQPFGPLAGHGRRVPWLFLSGNENSRHRYRRDLEGLLQHFTPDQREVLLDLLHFHVVEQIEETMTASTLGRITETVRQVGAGSVVVDPLGDVLSGDANADLDVRASLRALAQSVWRANPVACLALIHHARTGRLNIAQAVGYDRANYGKGSKALYAACRAVINMAPGDPDDTAKVVFSCGKCNDARSFDTFGLRLDNGLYVPDADFDVDAWTADLEGRRAGATFSIQDIVDHLASLPSGGCSQKDLAVALGVTKGAVSKKVTQGIKGGFLRVRRAGRETVVISTGKASPRVPVADAATDLL
jgi:hypothetical protein